MSVLESFVGCDAHVLTVQEALDTARRARGSTVVLHGEPGTGKTHLLHHLEATFAHDAAVVSASCAATGDIPFGPWQTILDGNRRTRSAGQAATPRDIADRLLASWAAMPTPVLVLLDDADDIDASSLQVLELLHHSIATEAVVLVVSTRTDRLVGDLATDTTTAATGVRSVGLSGLTEDDLVTLLQTYDPAADPHEAHQAACRLIDECDGHPLAILCRLRRWEHQVAATDLVRTVLSAPPSNRRSPRQWLQHAVNELDLEHRHTLGRWVLAPTLTRAEFCDATATPRSELDDALIAATEQGLMISPWVTPSEIPATIRLLFTAVLPPDQAAQTHLVLSRYLLGHRHDALIDAAHHLERASHLAPVDVVVDTMTRAGTLALATGAHHEAERLFRIADELAPLAHDRPRRLLHTAEAVRGQGRPTEARALARHAAELAWDHGEADLLAEAALAMTLPVDWRVGDAATQRFLEEALDARPSPPLRVRAQAALALQRFQVPRSNDAHHQWAWQFRPESAAALTHDALEQARRLGDDDALVAALLAWRSVHRRPGDLTKRREISNEALSIAVRRRDTSAMVQAAIPVAVDELESAHRDGFEHAVVVARWAADQSTNPLLSWRAHLLEATKALLDADVDALQRAKASAVRIGREAQAQGREATELTLDRHVLALTDGWSVVATMLPEPDWPLMHHPLGVAGAAEALARAGRVDHAQRLLNRLRWPANPHASMLLVTTLAGRAAVMCRDSVTAAQILPTLVDYADHVAVDPEAIWVEGPVALAAAQVARFLGDTTVADSMTDRAILMNTGLDCARTSGLLVARQRLAGSPIVLPEREQAVLRLLADGLGNAQIAQALNVSVSTIRRETSSLYHRLSVGNRASAVTRAHALGLL